MKVKITRLFFDGMRRHRPGSVINITNERYTEEDLKVEQERRAKENIKFPVRWKVGDLKGFAPSCMELVDEKTKIVDVQRPPISSEAQKVSDQEVI